MKLTGKSVKLLKLTDFRACVLKSTSSCIVLHILPKCVYVLNGLIHKYPDHICVKISEQRIHSIACVARRLACQRVVVHVSFIMISGRPPNTHFCGTWVQARGVYSYFIVETGGLKIFFN